MKFPAAAGFPAWTANLSNFAEQAPPASRLWRLFDPFTRLKTGAGNCSWAFL